MKIVFLILSLSVLPLFSGCTSSGHVSESRPSELSVGMTRQDVMKKIGRPQSVTSRGQLEILGYAVDRPFWRTDKLEVRLAGGRVQSYEVLDN